MRRTSAVKDTPVSFQNSTTDMKYTATANHTKEPRATGLWCESPINFLATVLIGNRTAKAATPMKNSTNRPTPSKPSCTSWWVTVGSPRDRCYIELIVFLLHSADRQFGIFTIPATSDLSSSGPLYSDGDDLPFAVAFEPGVGPDEGALRVSSLKMNAALGVELQVRQLIGRNSF